MASLLRTAAIRLITGGPLLSSGCAPSTPSVAPHAPLAPTSALTPRGLIWLLPGIEGGPWSLGWAERALRDAGASGEIRKYSWKRAFGLTNLTDLPGNQARAACLAVEIADFKRAHPHEPVDLVGYSGGGGLAILVAEALPPDVHLRRVVLVQPALSREYDLSRALARVDERMVNLHSPGDWFTLGVGTYVFGTIDRVHAASAGKDGFLVERAVPRAAERCKLIQREWSREMRSAGHFGNHFPIVFYRWNREFVAPLLLESE